MARARNLKPGFFLNEYLGTCDPLEALLFEGLWTLADRDGRLEFRPLKIKAQIFPYRDVSAQVITGFIRNLSSNGFLECYSVDGQEYIEVCNFAKHQNPHKNEKPSELPARPEKSTPCEDSSNDASDTDKNGSAPADSLFSDSLIPDSQIPDSAPDKPDANDSADDEIPDEPDPVILLPTNRYDSAGEQFGVMPDLYTELIELYPAVDVDQALRNMRGWLLSNKSNRKTISGMPKFINGWLTREQDRGGNHAKAQRNNPSSSFDHDDTSWIAELSATGTD